jgi:diacylglycerol kinase (ATP)
MDKFSITARLKSFTYAFKGVLHIYSKEHNMWIHLLATIIVILSGCYYHISSTEWIAVCIAIGFVISAELFNSAIEKLVNLVSPGVHPLAGLIKDIAAGAVLIAAITAAVIGIIVFGPRVF